MKKLILGILLGIALFLPTANAEQIFYQKEDFKVSISKPTACILYDFKNEELLGGGKVSILQYKKLNGDVGLIGDEFNEENVDFFVGVSFDVGELQINENIYANVGLFVSPGWIDDKEERYGGYGGLTYTW